jgi:hypothetical protein
VQTKEPRPATKIPPSSSAEGPFSRRDLQVLALITLVAAGLRLYRLGTWSLWIDEAHTYRDFLSPASEFWRGNVRSYPLSYLFMRWLAPALPSYDETWLRLPFAFFGIVSVPTLALMGRAVVGRQAALTGAFLLAVCPWHIYWSQNCRGYSLLLFLVILAAAGWWQAVYRRFTAGYLAAFVCTALAGLTHWSGYVMFVVFALHWVTVFWFRGREDMTRLERWLPVGAVLMLVALVPILFPIFSKAVEKASLAHARDSIVDVVVHMSQTTIYFLRLTLAIAALGGLLWLWGRVRPAQDFLIYWAIVPFVAVLGAAATLGVLVTAQYAIALLPACCLLAGAGFAALRERWSASGWRMRAVGFVPLAVLAVDMVGYDVLYFTKQYGDRPRWKEAAAFVQADAGKKKLIFTTNEPSLRYYLNVDIVKSAAPAQENLIISGLEPWQRRKSPFVDPGTGKFLNGDQSPARGDAFLGSVIAEAGELGFKVYVIMTFPELEEMDDKNSMISFLHGEMHAVKWLDCWTGPKDMIVYVFKAREK